MTASPCYQPQEATQCAACGFALPESAGPRQTLHKHCRRLRSFAAAIRRLVDEHPELREVAARELATTGSKPRRVSGGPRPAGRDKRRETYISFELWAQVRAMTRRIPGATLSAVVRYALRWFFTTGLPYQHYVMSDEGEVVSAVDEAS